MISFSMGLALLINGFILYKLANVIAAPTISPAGVAAPETAKTLAGMLNVPAAIASYLPYIGVIIMAIGVVWFWLIKLLFYLTRPPKEEDSILRV